ncbi:MAG: hypothetical protein AABZ30_01185, partial [Myxococcota bacterium]
RHGATLARVKLGDGLGAIDEIVAAVVLDPHAPELRALLRDLVAASPDPAAARAHLHRAAAPLPARLRGEILALASDGKPH